MYYICFVINIGLSPSLWSWVGRVGVGEETTYYSLLSHTVIIRKKCSWFLWIKLLIKLQMFLCDYLLSFQYGACLKPLLLSLLFPLSHFHLSKICISQFPVETVSILYKVDFLDLSSLLYFSMPMCPEIGAFLICLYTHSLTYFHKILDRKRD